MIYCGKCACKERFLLSPLISYDDFMTKFLVRYKRTGDHKFETVVDVNNAYTPNQAMIKIQENRSMYKDLDFSDVEILGVEKVESWRQ